MRQQQDRAESGRERVESVEKALNPVPKKQVPEKYEEDKVGESVVANKEIQEKQSKNASKASKHKREEKQELKKRQAEEKNKILHP